MEIEVLRIGQRVVRDDRVTTHVALVARSFGAQKIYMNEVNPEIKHVISNINKTWGGDFEIEIISEWKKIVKEKKNAVNPPIFSWPSVIETKLPFSKSNI